LHLVTQKLHTALVIRPRQLQDLQARVWIVALPGGDREVTKLWREQSESLGRQIKPQVQYCEFQQTRSELERTSDIYHQEFRIRDGHLPPDLAELRLNITAAIDQDALREEWTLTRLPSTHEAWLVYWFQSEIGASSEMQSTIFYEKGFALCSYRGPVCFGLQALCRGQSLPVVHADCGALQHQTAASRFADLLRGSWSRDELLGFYHTAARMEPATWVIEPRSLCSLGATDGMIAWQMPRNESFELRFRLAKSLVDFEKPLEPLDFEAIRGADQTWLKQQKAAPTNLTPSLRDLYARTLLTLRQMQDPGGGIIAAPEFHYAFTHCGGYGFCWGRDAGFISYAMDVCGMHAESDRFYRYMKLCQNADGSFLHRHDMQGYLGSSWGLLQPDETGSVLFGLWKHYSMAKNPQVIEDLRDMIDKAANWLADARHSFDPMLPIEGFDLWEEREGVHLYSVAAMAAGLEAACHIYEAMNWSVPNKWSTRAQELVELCNSSRFIQNNPKDVAFARTLRRRINSGLLARSEQMGLPVFRGTSPTGRMLFELEQDFVLDISQVAVSYPYRVIDIKRHGEALDQLIEQIYARLWRPGQGGIGRYEADFYRDGNPWILTTLWLALAAAERGKLEIAQSAWDWVLAHIPEEGLLPEQIDPENGRTAWVLPLTWSHAMFALAIHQLPKEVLS
jgi:hypothetical protein